ncbi:hypothetical protein K3495_g6231 [Podosphaera aphanis]|nr:hypothetical protein K3495_g6231 [Podosphaera aphanis]
MKLLLVRHGETVDNVAGRLAGITDSCLTSHGTVQATRLGQHLSRSGHHIVQIFSSDLQRAYLTAEAIRDHQIKKPESILALEILREKDFGTHEGQKISKRKREPDSETMTDRPNVTAENGESRNSMITRANLFIDQQLAKAILDAKESHTVVVVSHGIFLRHLWWCLVNRFHRDNTRSLFESGDHPTDYTNHIGSWSNTGYLEISIERPDMEPPPDNSSRNENITASKLDVSIGGIPSTSKKATPIGPKSHLIASGYSPVSSMTLNNYSKVLLEMILVIISINNRQHLKGLKKTPRGIGSLKHDNRQKVMDSFFTKRAG